MSGYLEDLSPKQEAILQQFKENMNDMLTEDYDDRLLLQFLRARSFDIIKAENMFRKHVTWRKKYPKKFLLEEYKPPETLEKYIQFPFLGFDNEGSPIRVLVCETYDLRGMISAFKPHELNQYAAYILEKDRAATEEYNKKFNRHVEGRTAILDLTKLNLKPILYKPVLTYLVSVLKMYEANYPESLKIAYVINIPYFFSLIFNIAKSVADDRTLKKVHIYADNSWKEDILKTVDADLLPDWLGHPDYVSMCNFPTVIPEKYYLRNQNKLQRDAENVHQIYLRRRSRQEMPMYIDSTGSTIVWYVECPYGDINVGLFYKNRQYSESQYGDSKLEEVVPFSKAGGDFGPLSETYVNRKSGIYVLVFDNTFSFIRSKYIMYTFNVLPPLAKMIPETENFDDYEVLCEN